VTPPAPRTLFNDLARLGLVLLQGTRLPTELEVRRFEKDIETVSRIDPVGYLQLRGFAAALRDDHAEVDALFERALSISSQRLGAVMRYMAILAATGRSQAVIDLFQKYRDDICGDPAALCGAEGALRFSGWFATGNAVGRELTKRGLRATPTFDTEFSEEFLSEEEVARVVGFSHRFLRDRGSVAKCVQATHIFHESGGATLLYQLAVDAQPEALAELEWDLFGALAEAAVPVQEQGLLCIALAVWDDMEVPHARDAS
jgi:tetratricopeptide (TPR) repeat protein